MFSIRPFVHDAVSAISMVSETLVSRASWNGGELALFGVMVRRGRWRQALSSNYLLRSSVMLLQCCTLCVCLLWLVSSNAGKWPSKLQMNLIPNTLLSPLQSLFRNSRTVGFNFVPKDSEALNSLFRVMAAGFVSSFPRPFSVPNFIILYCSS